jgi:hypothetical protein
VQVLGLDLQLPRETLGDLHGGRAQDGADLALQAADTGLARVLANDGAQRLVGDLDVLHRRIRAFQAVRLELALDEVTLGDLELLLFGVAGELDDLHAVAQRARDGVEHVRRGDEQNLRQVEVDREVIVAEVRILLGIEHLEQRRGRVAVEAALP